MKQALELTTPFDIAANGDIILPADELAIAAEHPSEGWIDGYLSQEDRAMIAVSPNAVDLATRAGHLARALDDIGPNNSRSGFGKAVHSAERRPAIEARYGDNTDGVAEGVAYNALVGEHRARYEFFAAQGLGNLALATKSTELTADERVARRSLNDAWLSFRRVYGATGPRASAARHAYKKVLNEHIALIQTPVSA